MFEETLRARLAAAFAATMAFMPAAAEAAEAWTFCVAASRSGADVYISDVFPAEGNRERFEAAFNSAVERLSGRGADTQCPQPHEDKMVAVSAQFDAEAFNRKMGAKLHAVPTSVFLGSRIIASPTPPHGKRAPKAQDILPVGSNGKARQ
ncbi:MAG TPA: hypothetical protein VMI72_03170 [Roseiarcus sp.]|nr:hypothetical protein [Roseiarcus sp.]